MCTLQRRRKLLRLNGLEMLFSLSTGSARWCKFVFIFSQMQSLHSHDLALLSCCGVKWLRSRLVYRSRRAECNSSKVFVYDNSPHKACGTLFSFLVARLIQKAILWKKFACGVPWVTRVLRVNGNLGFEYIFLCSSRVAIKTFIE